MAWFVSPARGWLISALLIGTGLIESALLLARGFALSSSTPHAGFDLCSTLFAGSCDTALTDPRFEFLRVPVAGWGLVYFTTLAGLLFLGWFVRRTFEAEALLAASLTTLVGLTVGLTLSLSAWLMHLPFCPLCLSVHTVSLLLLVTLRMASAQSIRAQIQHLRAAVLWFVRSEPGSPEPVRWKLVGFACVALVAAMTYQWVFVESALRRPRVARTPSRNEVLAAYRAAPEVVLPVSGDDPHWGPLTAPVRLVVFASFRCPACRRFAGTVSRLHRVFGDHLLVVYKHYPLSTECNGRLTRDLQPGSCEIARAAQAAHRQAQFWPFHDDLLAAGSGEPKALIGAVVSRLRLDPAQFAADCESEDTGKHVAEDIALGNRLKLPGTPSVFLDGRLVGSPSTETLETLIRDELERRGAGAARVQLGRVLAGP